MKKTENGARLWLNLALNYGGRAEIIDAVRQIASLAKANRIDIAQIDERLFSRHTYTANLPDPELLIRTGGDFRISNFLLWQVAYTELHFAQEFWPDFDEVCFCRALLDYASRDRRFGGVNEK